MKICAIEIKSNKAVFVVLEKKQDNQINEISGKFKFASLENDEDQKELTTFIDLLHSQLDYIIPDRIAIIRRSSKGKFSASSVSFKIEGLIQSYKKIPVEFFAPQTIRAFYKKNSMPLTPAYNYQMSAMELAYMMLQ